MRAALFGVENINLPNILTSLRILLIPILVAAFYLVPYESRYLLAAFIFTVASLTDWLDGYLARKLGQQTPFGAFLDPVADKLIVAVALVLLVQIHASPWLALPASVIVGREIVVSALREWMARYSEKRSVAVSLLGKIKTVAQMVAIILLLGLGPKDDLFVLFGFGLLYFSAFLTLWSMYEYLKIAWPDLVSGMRNDL